MSGGPTSTKTTGGDGQSSPVNRKNQWLALHCWSEFFASSGEMGPQRREKAIP